jgi:E3 ubiquitin-protein ligase ZSWIM2
MRFTSFNSLVFKVCLGNHFCSCPTFTREKELCVHLLWVMLKVFRIDKHDESIFQLQLVDREITSLLDARNLQIQMSQEIAEDAKQELQTHNDTTSVREVNKREIEQGDVCPICQDDLNDESAPTLHCKRSCGNNLHSKCLKILLDHLKAMGQDSVKCPLCRTEGFGTVDEINAQLTDIEALKKEQKQKGRIRHYGTACAGCQKSPITGDMYRCVVCTVRLIYSYCRIYFSVRVVSDLENTMSMPLKRGLRKDHRGVAPVALSMRSWRLLLWNNYKAENSATRIMNYS